MTRLPDLEDLSIFTHIARTGSIGSTATELGLSQPSVSRRMAALERRLQVTLLARSPRGTVLTASGKVVVDWATSLLQAAEQFDRSVQTLRDQDAVTVRAAVSMTIAESHVPTWVATLNVTSPDAVVSLVVHNSTEVARLVESGEADIGFLEAPTVRRSLQRKRIGVDRLVLAVAPDHPWANRSTPLRAEEVATGRLLVRESGSGTRETLESALLATGHPLVPGPVLGSNAALKLAARTGLAPVVLSELALAAELETGSLLELATDGLDLTRPLSAVWRRDEPLAEGAQALLKVAASTQ